MKPRETSFARLISEVESGSQEASWELIATYSPFVFRVVRKLLPRQMRKAFDSADFVQVAWGTMFRHRSRLCRFETPAEFTAFLAAVTANKVRMEIRRRLYQQKHNITRDVSIGQAEEDGLSDEPSPSQVAIRAKDGFSCWSTNRRTIRRSSSCAIWGISRVRSLVDWDSTKGLFAAYCGRYSEI